MLSTLCPHRTGQSRKAKSPASSGKKSGKSGDGVLDLGKERFGGKLSEQLDLRACSLRTVFPKVGRPPDPQLLGSFIFYMLSSVLFLRRRLQPPTEYT
jgi:hypothetical protein